MAQELIASGKDLRTLQAQMPAIMAYYAPGDRGILTLELPHTPLEFLAEWQKGTVQKAIAESFGDVLDGSVTREGNLLKIPFRIPETPPPGIQQTAFPALGWVGLLMARVLAGLLVTFGAILIIAALIPLIIWAVYHIIKAALGTLFPDIGALDPLTVTLGILFLGATVYTLKQLGGSSAGKELGRKILVLD